MSREDRLLILKVRLNKLESSPKAQDCPGVITKVKRQIRNLEK